MATAMAFQVSLKTTASMLCDSSFTFSSSPIRARSSCGDTTSSLPQHTRRKAAPVFWLLHARVQCADDVMQAAPASTQWQRDFRSVMQLLCLLLDITKRTQQKDGGHTKCARATHSSR